MLYPKAINDDDDEDEDDDYNDNDNDDDEGNSELLRCKETSLLTAASKHCCSPHFRLKCSRLRVRRARGCAEARERESKRQRGKQPANAVALCLASGDRAGTL